MHRGRNLNRPVFYCGNQNFPGYALPIYCNNGYHGEQFYSASIPYLPTDAQYCPVVHNSSYEPYYGDLEQERYPQNQPQYNDTRGKYRKNYRRRGFASTSQRRWVGYEPGMQHPAPEQHYTPANWQTSCPRARGFYKSPNTRSSGFYRSGRKFGRHRAALNFDKSFSDRQEITETDLMVSQNSQDSFNELQHIGKNKRHLASEGSLPVTDSTNIKFGYKSDPNFRETLISSLCNNTYECLICISTIRSNEPIWSCATCFHIYHLKCIKQWAVRSKNRESATNELWRCPSCQTQYDSSTQLTYHCFCGRQKHPTYHPARNTIPHGCDQICGRLKQSTIDFSERIKCVHGCTELCHPGPCPPCMVTVVAFCPCGKAKHSLTCGDLIPKPCNNVCSRRLNLSCAVGFHLCVENCHLGPCSPCGWIINTVCFCGHGSLKVMCGSEKAKELKFSVQDLNILRSAFDEFSLIRSNQSNLSCLSLNDIDVTTNPTTISGSVSIDCGINSPTIRPLITESHNELKSVTVGASYSCNRVCNNLLNCGYHSCPDFCHPGDCKLCSLDPPNCLTCPCGRVPLSKLVNSGDLYGDRKSCQDVVPTCPNLCARPRAICGHSCPQKCHSGPCPPCELTINLSCRCGRTTKNFHCKEFVEIAEQSGVPEFLCERVCRKTKQCGRHKCQKKCCIDLIHECSEPCGHRLACGQHNCEDTCHSGPCHSCWRGVITDELSCRCGFTVVHPPLPCGAGAPECDQPCNRQHDCDHPVQHTCHNQPTCPPCTVLMTKLCPGGHGVQFNLQCFQPVPTCGLPCKKKLPWCSHLCRRPCHGDPCVTDLSSDTCTQRCEQIRPECGHPCGLKCHQRSGLKCSQITHKGKYPPGPLPCKVLLDLICVCGKRKERKSCNEVQSLYIVLLEQQSNMTVFDKMVATHNEENPLPLLSCNKSCQETTNQEALTSDDSAEASGWKRGLVFAHDCEDDSHQQTDYPEAMVRFALSNFEFASNAENQLKCIFHKLSTKFDSLTKLDVAGFSQIERTSSYRFPPMNKKQRLFIHELAEFYGMQAISFDPEPKRHVMVLAKAGCVKLPDSLIKIVKKQLPGLVKLSRSVTQSRTQMKATSKLPSAIVSNFSYAQILREKSDQI